MVSSLWSPVCHAFQSFNFSSFCVFCTFCGSSSAAQRPASYPHFSISVFQRFSILLCLHPPYRIAVFANNGIMSQQAERFAQRLCDQHPVKWIFMVEW